ncbi:MAG TPA: molybdopterin dinucleotide binding domain-containing protein, partial [Acidimicrobiia bacterium]
SLQAGSVPLALHAARTLYDDGSTMRPSRILSRLAPGIRAWMHPKEAKARGLHEGDPVVVAINGSSLELAAGLDPSLLEGVLYLPLNQPGLEFPADVLEADLMPAKRS